MNTSTEHAETRAHSAPTTPCEDQSADRPGETSPGEQNSTSTGGGLSFGFIAVSTAAAFLFFNRENLMREGGFIYLIAAGVLGLLMAANMKSHRC